MNSVTNNYIWLKCYLNLFEIVANGKRGSLILARAINKFKKSIEKNIKNVYNAFSILISVFPSEYSTNHLTESPISAPKNFMISLGIVVLPDVELGLATDIFDSYSNTFISPIFVVLYIYLYTQRIYNIFHKIGRNIYI